jgi:hypothetical protein
MNCSGEMPACGSRKMRPTRNTSQVVSDVRAKTLLVIPCVILRSALEIKVFRPAMEIERFIRRPVG